MSWDHKTWACYLSFVNWFICFNHQIFGIHPKGLSWSERFVFKISYFVSNPDAWKKKNVWSKLFCILHWLSSWNVFDQLQSLKPMSSRLKRLKWSMIFSDSYCLRICCLPLDFFHYQTYDKFLTVFHVYV